MAGSELPKMEPQATWKAGSEVEVGWAIEAHHGGGYSYRLAPADEPLNEASFNKMPLHAVGPSILRWDGDKATQKEFNATRIVEGTFPKGSQWTKNPLPGPPMLWSREGPSFEPYCEESKDCTDTGNPWTRELPAPKPKGPEPSTGCAAALGKTCGKAAKGEACDACALNQWSPLKAAGCTEAEQVTWCTQPGHVQHWHPAPGTCKCSGSPNVFAWLEPNLEIVDTLKIPSDTKPGKYVLNWRWDVSAVPLPPSPPSPSLPTKWRGRF
jgi:hypothetical protein